MKRHRLGFFATAIVSLLLILGLRLVDPLPAQANTTLLVSAAASLKDVMEEIKPEFQKRNPTIRITYNFGASGALLQQIQQGAPVDVFISAATRQLDTLDKSGGLVAGTRRNLARNRLVLIAPKGSTAVSGFASLKNSQVKRIAIGETRSVPAGQYAEQVLNKLGIYSDIRSKLVLANNVRQVLASVESGNADAGLVYATDARISNKVKVVATADERFHSPIVYPMAVLKSSRNVDGARSFVQFLAGSEAKARLRKYGFIVSR